MGDIVTRAGDLDEAGVDGERGSINTSRGSDSSSDANGDEGEGEDGGLAELDGGGSAGEGNGAISGENVTLLAGQRLDKRKKYVKEGMRTAGTVVAVPAGT